jgi:hypothetical protein
MQKNRGAQNQNWTDPSSRSTCAISLEQGCPNGGTWSACGEPVVIMRPVRLSFSSAEYMLTSPI